MLKSTIFVTTKDVSMIEVFCYQIDLPSLDYYSLYLISITLSKEELGAQRENILDIHTPSVIR
jgi:hypothetical protein